MDPYEQFAFDAELAETGVWFDFTDGSRLRIARRDNPRYREALRALAKGKERLIQLKAISESELHEMRMRALARGVLLDWEGLTRDGEPLPYSEANVVALLTDLPEFCVQVESCAEDLVAFRREAEQDAEKNSERSCASISS